MINKPIREARYFFYSQAFADGLRASFAILLPAMVAARFDRFEMGLTISLGAMCVSLTDAPGPVVHKRNGMLIAAGFAFLTSLVAGWASVSVVTTAAMIGISSFFFSMFTVYGNRATAVGNASILVMILTMDTPRGIDNSLIQSLLILAGGLFYFTLSMLVYFIRPYRNAQRALGDCIREVANYLSARTDFYDPSIELDGVYKKVIAGQVEVNAKQDAIRELFFKTRQIVEETTPEGRKLVFTFVETVDLVEDITAAYYDYSLLRNQFAHTGALGVIHDSLKKIAGELDRAGRAIQNNSSFTKGFDYDEEVRQVKARIDLMLKNEPNALLLKKIIVNIRNLLTDLTNINQYFNKGIKRKKSSIDHSHFISHQALNPGIMWTNMSLESSVFRHAVRVSIACLTGYAISRIIAYGDHSYWILLTIAFILKPAFSLTRQRNIERIIGTFAGGLIGILILVFFPGKTVQFVFLVIFMVGTYSFMRINYLVMVICTTPYVLILFSFFGFFFRDVASERMLDTLIGCAIALSASYFLFPKWESEELRSFMKHLLRANAGYMDKIIQGLSGTKPALLDYKLARKEVYLNSANLAAAFQRMLSEPKNKQSSSRQVHQFVVLNHILSSNVATIATSLLAKEPRLHPEELVHLAKKSYAKILDSAQRLGEKITPATINTNTIPVMVPETADDVLMKEQLQFIYAVSIDIDKTVKGFIE